MKKILITGGSGFIGTNLVDFYSGRGFDVLNVDTDPPRDERHQKLWCRCDILDRPKYQETLLNFSPDVLFHLAARTDLDGNTIEDYRANTEGVQNTIDVIKSTDSIKRVVFASSRMVCRIDHIPSDEFDYCPPNAYGVSKVAGEKLVRRSAIERPWIIVRPTSIWGPWFDIPYKLFFNTIAKGSYFHPGAFDPDKSFGYVGNTVFELDQIVNAPEDSIDGKTIYLCDYPAINVKNWANRINAEMGKPPIRTIPFPLLKAAAKAGDFIKGVGVDGFPITSFRLNNLITEMVYDTSELASICGPLPYSMEEGVVETVAHMKQTKSI
ncbi:NAD-dependent epimerase/dehydratase family protein [Persicitalea sp.]|uniref:NAD-dependent epimerase/dehydratase family protein n=1 Tax=Persicitalea sp. TaxID=3100273 RepID=UPI0035945423